MKILQHLLDQNRDWSDAIKDNDPEFFHKLAQQQTPEYLWIGCSDSRVPANDIVGLLPGELFVHRNVANVVVHSDLNCLSVMQFAIEYLKVKHIIVCGHYGCGGVRAAMQSQELGLIDNWLRAVKDVYHTNEPVFEYIESEEDRVNKLCELNVIRQVENVCHTTIVQNAWLRGQPLSVHGWIYGIEDGRLKDMNVCVNAADQVDKIYRYTL